MIVDADPVRPAEDRIRTISGIAVLLIGAGALSALSGALAATSTSNLNVTATITSSCTILSGGAVVNFGTKSFINSNVTASTVILVQCTSTTPWTVGIDNGANASGSQRRMTDGASHFISYGLYTDSARTLAWTTSNSGASCTGGTGTCASGTGDGNFQFINVYGQVPPQIAQATGNYSDVVVATVTY